MEQPVDRVAAALAVVECGLCDDDGYRGFRVCDHVDRAKVAAAGIAKCRKALKKQPRKTQESM